MADLESTLPSGVVLDTKGKGKLKKRLRNSQFKRPIKKKGQIKKKSLKKNSTEKKVKDVTSIQPKFPYKMRLQFEGPCPPLKEISSLHPAICNVSKPKRPPNARWCTLKFTSAELREEARTALHNQRVEPYRGKLRCYYTTPEVLSDIPDLEETNMTRQELILTKIIHNKVKKETASTIDVKLNSTERELRVRYGFIPNVL